VLTDYHVWRLQLVEQGSQRHKELTPVPLTPVPLADSKACLESQKSELRFGDALIIRSGELTPSFWVYHDRYPSDSGYRLDSCSVPKADEEPRVLQETLPHTFVSLEQKEEMLRWSRRTSLPWLGIGRVSSISQRRTSGLSIRPFSQDGGAP